MDASALMGVAGGGMGMPNVNDTTSTSASQSNKNSGASTGGYHNAIVNNYALGGSSLSAAMTAGGALPVWVYYVGGALILGLAWWAWKKKG
jgi:hypothetical protein